MFSDGEGVVFNVERMDPVGDPNSSTSHAAGDLLIPFTVSLVQFWARLFKLTTSLVNDSLKFQTLIYQIYQYFLLKICEKLLQCKSFSHFFNKKFQCVWL